MASEREDPYRREYREKMLLESEHAPGGVILYFADGDEEIIHVNQYIVDLFECESVDEFLRLTHGSFKGLVCAIDEDVFARVKGENKSRRSSQESLALDVGVRGSH